MFIYFPLLVMVMADVGMTPPFGWTPIGPATTVGRMVWATTAWGSCCCMLTTGSAGWRPETAVTTETTGREPTPGLLLLSSAGFLRATVSGMENCWKGMKACEAGIWRALTAGWTAKSAVVTSCGRDMLVVLMMMSAVCLLAHESPISD